MSAARRWAVTGAALGLAAGLAWFAPATWLARAVKTASGGHVLLAEARGTIWSGHAVAVLTGGPGSRDAAALPGRLEWDFGWTTKGLALRLRHACCLSGEQELVLRPGLGRWSIVVPASPQALGHWPAAWLAGLGTPWNTLQLMGSLRLMSSGMQLENVRGRWRIDGRVGLDLSDIASSVSTLPVLGSYRLDVAGDAEHGEGARLSLSTLSGALRLQGQGQWTGPALHFRGDARAESGAERALDNLLNIIGRRQGALSLIAIG